MPPDDVTSSTERWSMIEHYEAIAGASKRMLDAARAEDWDAVGREEDTCRRLIARLKQAHADGRVAAERRQRLALLRMILADDAEIRELSEPWLRQLEALLGGGRRGDRASAP